MKTAFNFRSIENDPTWLLEQEGFDPSREREMETLFAIGNGRVGVRGSSDFPIPTAQPDFLIAGVYDKKAMGLPYSEIELLAKTGREGDETEIVPFPSPLHWKFAVGETSFQAGSPKILEHKRTLDLKRGIAHEFHRLEDQQGRRACTHTLKLASLSDLHFLVQQVTVSSENYSGTTRLEFPIKIDGFDNLYPHLNTLEQGTFEGSVQLLVYQTQASQVTVAFGTKVFVNQEALEADIYIQNIKPGESIRAIRYVAVYSSLDTANPRSEVKNHLARLTWNDFEPRVQEHETAWNGFWDKANLIFENAPALTQAQRFNLYHLRIAADHDATVSIPAKALTGRAYEGHVFWDTEIFMFPFYLYTEPEIAKQLLLYRYHTLNGARCRAAEMGCQGACYAWESTVTGKDVTPKFILVADTQAQVPVHTGAQQIHVTADVAYALWQYWDATLDHQFLLEFGAEIFFETARFWMSRSIERDQVFHIQGVVGPDEYHYNVEDNAYTNWMARFNLERGIWVFDWMLDRFPDHLAALKMKLGLEDQERKLWGEAVKRIYFPTPNAAGVIEQFRDFFKLKPVVIPNYEKNRPPISRLLKWEEINALQLVKQADVLMLPFLFPRSFSTEFIVSNYLYYEPITDHGSSLSPSIHAAIAARARRKSAALKYWEASLHLDLLNSMGNVELGIHAATLGGTWQALVFHMLGVFWNEKGLHFAAEPDFVLPKNCTKVELKLTYRGKIYPLRFGRRRKAAA